MGCGSPHHHRLFSSILLSRGIRDRDWKISFAISHYRGLRWNKARLLPSYNFIFCTGSTKIGPSEMSVHATEMKHLRYLGTREEQCSGDDDHDSSSFVRSFGVSVLPSVGTDNKWAWTGTRWWLTSHEQHGLHTTTTTTTTCSHHGHEHIRYWGHYLMGVKYCCMIYRYHYFFQFTIRWMI